MSRNNFNPFLIGPKEVKKAKKIKNEEAKNNPNVTMMLPKQKDESFVIGKNLKKNKNGNNSMLVDENERQNFLMDFDAK